MTFWRSLGLSALVFGLLTLLAFGCWTVTGDGSFDIGVTFALIPCLLVSLYLGYRLVRARVGDLLPFVIAVLTVAPALVVGWAGFQVARHHLGRRIGPIPVEDYVRLGKRNAARTILRGRVLWKDGLRLEIRTSGGTLVRDILPFVPVDWKPGDPIHVWALGGSHRLKRADFDGCGYPESVPCHLNLYEPHQRELRLQLIRGGKVPGQGGLDFVILEADYDRLWLPLRLAGVLVPAWLLLLTLWLRRTSRLAAAREAARAAA
jgi:hypothetical protein